MSIQVSQVSKRFGAFQALREVDLQVGQGELVALLGPSGCGKTTLLRIIAGLEVADGGRILFDGEDVTGTDVRQREVGFVFQHYALFRHMTVFDNVAFGLTVRPRGQRLSAPQIKARVTELLERVQLESLANRHPSQLSGGQRQRVALARALAVQPRVLLLDEPFGALDAQVRKELRRWVRRLHEELHVTSVFVTHDQEEALEVADRVVLMHQGQVEQVGTPQEVWDDPASAFVCGFLGDVNRLSGRAHEGQLHLDGVVLGAAEHALARDAAASAYVRPHDLDVQPWRPGEPGIVASLQRAIVLGPIARLELMPINKPGPAGSDSTIEARIPAERFRELGLREGATLSVLPRKARVFLEPAGQPA